MAHVDSSFEVRIKVFFEGIELPDKETYHKGGEYILDMICAFFEEDNGFRYTVIVFHNGDIKSVSEKASGKRIKEVFRKL